MGNWKLLIDRDSGELVSVGTVVADDAADRFDVVDAGEDRPDQSDVQWDRGQRAFVPRPARVLIDRLDDIEGWLLADADWKAVWDSLSVTRKTQVRAGLRRVLMRLLAERRYRDNDEAAEV